MKEAITKLLEESRKFSEIMGESSGVQSKFNKLLEDAIKGHFRQKEKELKGRIDGVILKLGDECICFDIASFFSVLDKKYAELLEIITQNIRAINVNKGLYVTIGNYRDN